MYHRTDIPIHNKTPEPDFNHSISQRYIEYVNTKFTTRVFKFICAILVGFLIVIGVITFILWISLRPHRPRFHLLEFTVEGLDQFEGFEGARVIFNLTARNPNQNVGYYYDAMQVTLTYQDQDIGSTNLSSPFHQKPKNTRMLHGVLSGETLRMNKQLWTQIQDDRKLGVVMFRLDVSSMIRYEIVSWNSSRHKFHATCDVGVGPNGTVLPSYKEKRFGVYFF